MPEKSKILVTGGAGYIGSHTVVELADAGFIPVILDDFRNSKPWIIDRLKDLTGLDISSYEVDCNDVKSLREVFEKEKNINGVIHFAADKAVGESVQNPLKYYTNNVGSLCAILSVMKAFNVVNFVFSSSCTVYGDPDEIPVDENAPIKLALSPYGDTKIICERIIQAEIETGASLKAILLRYFNPIGAHFTRKIGELPQGVPNNLVPYITQTAKGIRKELTVYGNDYDTPDGTNVRDYIHVVDLAKAHVLALNHAQKAKNSFCDAFNIGTGTGTSVLEIIRNFEEVSGLQLNYKIGPRRNGDVDKIYANADKAKSVLNWQPKLTIKDALEHSWDWEKNGIK